MDSSEKSTGGTTATESAPHMMTMKRYTDEPSTQGLDRLTDSPQSTDTTRDRTLKRLKLDQDLTVENHDNNNNNNECIPTIHTPIPTSLPSNNRSTATPENDSEDTEELHLTLSGEEAEEDTASDDSLAPELLHSALRLDDDIDVEESDEESQHVIPWTSFTEEEMEAIQEDARDVGLVKFIEKYVLQEHVPVAKLLEVFGLVMSPRAILLASDYDLAPLLRTAVNRFLRKRRRLDHVNTLEDVVSLMAKAQNIMIVTGAGVSVSCGIPDFRSETGIYSRLQEYQLDDPQQMFDIEYFRDSPEIFYSFAKELYPSNYVPSPSHQFVKLVEDQGKLLRNYTQNIDTLEQKSKIKNVVNCHGSFATASCVTCGYKCDGKDIEQYIFSQTVPPCPKCPAPAPPLKKRNTNRDDDDDDDDDDHIRKGVSIMKPDITFFGEKLPDEFDHLLAIDAEKVDLLIAMGSSLKVSPVSEIMTRVPHRVPQILINRTPITHMTFDVQLLGNADAIVPELCRRLGWDLRHEKLPGGSALSEQSRAAEGLWKQIADGLYTFPGAVLDESCFELLRCGELKSSHSDLDDSDDDDTAGDLVTDARDTF